MCLLLNKSAILHHKIFIKKLFAGNFSTEKILRICTMGRFYFECAALFVLI